MSAKLTNQIANWVIEEAIKTASDKKRRFSINSDLFKMINIIEKRISKEDFSGFLLFLRGKLKDA